MKEPKLNFNTPTHDLPDASIWAYLHAQGYHIVENGFYVKDVNEFLTAIPHTRLRDRRQFDHAVNFYINDEQLFIWLNQSGHITIWSKGGQEAITRFLEKYYDLFLIGTSRKIGIIYYYMNAGKVDSSRVMLDLDKMHQTYPELYPDIDIALLNEEFNKSSDSILVLYGPPGVGKTTFLKYMLDVHHYSDIIYVKDTNVMKHGGFWSEMIGSDYGLMILDDLDFALGPRRDDTDSTFVSNLLSYSDGIFNKSAKIVITTNQPINEMDVALTRPGRCFDFLTLNPLSQKQAQTFWTDSLQRQIAEYFNNFNSKQDTITQAEIMNVHRRLSVGIKRSYMRDGSTVSLEDRLHEAGVNVGKDAVSF